MEEWLTGPSYCRPERDRSEARPLSQGHRHVEIVVLGATVTELRRDRANVEVAMTFGHGHVEAL